MTKNRFYKTAVWLVICWLMPLLRGGSVWAVSEHGEARPADGALPVDAGPVSRFLADLSAEHAVGYALLGFLVVTFAAFALSLISERLMKWVAIKGALGAHGRRD